MRDRFILSAILVVAAVTGIAVLNSQAVPQAINDIQITTNNSKICNGEINVKSLVVYASNTNTGRFIDATIKYDSNPSGQSFALYDADTEPFTDQFPKQIVVRIAPHQTVQVGCTYTYRSSNTPHQVTKVPLVTTVASATYVTAGQVSEDARSFVAFILGTGLGRCPPGAKPQGELALVNLHPYARLRVRIEQANGGHSEELWPLQASLSPVACTNGDKRVTAVSNPELIYPPTHP